MQPNPKMISMESKVDFLRINPVKEYTLTDIEVLNLIPWAKNGRTIRKAIAADRRGANLLGAKIKGAESQRRYIVPARGIIKYLKAYGPALMGTVRKPKHNGNTTKRTGKKNRAVPKRA